uniref:Putative secreted protein n=1 Tax=Anopheles triannulatus TaxID=58253 RepID=A0A2M4B2C7_9DIPT
MTLLLVLLLVPLLGRDVRATITPRNTTSNQAKGRGGVFVVLFFSFCVALRCLRWSSYWPAHLSASGFGFRRARPGTMRSSRARVCVDVGAVERANIDMPAAEFGSKRMATVRLDRRRCVCSVRSWSSGARVRVTHRGRRFAYCALCLWRRRQRRRRLNVAAFAFRERFVGAKCKMRCFIE